jgi:hypothetical protein
MARSYYRDPSGRFASAPSVPTRKPPTLAEETYAGVEAGVAHDLGPWVETPASSRVSRFRFDHLQRQLQVQWRNNKNPGYLYENVDYEGYRSFARVVSKGRHINSTLNGHVYRPMLPSEIDAPSNEKRQGIGSRLRT